MLSCKSALKCEGIVVNYLRQVADTTVVELYDCLNSELYTAAASLLSPTNPKPLLRVYPIWITQFLRRPRTFQSLMYNPTTLLSHKFPSCGPPSLSCLFLPDKLFHLFELHLYRFIQVASTSFGAVWKPERLWNQTDRTKTPTGLIEILDDETKKTKQVNCSPKCANGNQQGLFPHDSPF